MLTVMIADWTHCRMTAAFPGHDCFIKVKLGIDIPDFICFN